MVGREFKKAHMYKFGQMLSKHNMGTIVNIVLMAII